MGNLISAANSVYMVSQKKKIRGRLFFGKFDKLKVTFTQQD